MRLFPPTSFAPSRSDAVSPDPTEVAKRLLGFMAHAALLIENHTQRRIIHANEQAALHSGYTLEQITTLAWGQLFPEMSWGKIVLLAGEKVHTFLQTRAGQSVAVWCQAQQIAEDDSLWLVLFAPLEETVPSSSQDEEERQRLHKGVGLLLHSWDAATAEDALQHAMVGAWYVLRAVWGGLYLVDTPSYRLIAEAGAADGIPLALPLTYSEAFAMPRLYRAPPQGSGHPAFDALVRWGKTPYLVIAPLGNDKGDKSIEGFVVFGFSEEMSADVLTKATLLGFYLGRMVAFFHCCAPKHTAEEASMPANTLLQALFRHAREATLVFDRDMRLVDLNRSAEEMFGYERSEVLGTAFPDLLVGETVLEATAYKAMLHGPAVFHETKARLLRRDGSEFPAEVRIVSYGQGAESPAGILVLVEDLSKEAHYQEQTEALMRRAMLGDVLASFAHEVRDPLNSLSTGLEWLAFSSSEDSESQEILRNLQQEVDRLSHLVTHLLDYSRARRFHWQPMDIGVVLRGIFRRWRRRFERYRIDARLHLATSLPPVLGDRLSLEQVFTNLIDNAIHALAEVEGDRFLVVSAKTVTEKKTIWVEVDVVDNGPGFDEKTRAHLFDPFFTARKDGSGTGLGLAIARQLITAHKGSIHAASYPQAGTVFQVRLPLAAQERN